MRLFVCMKFYILFKEREIAMKTKLKSKIVSALLVCMLVVGFVPTTVFAADTATVDSSWKMVYRYNAVKELLFWIHKTRH